MNTKKTCTIANRFDYSKAEKCIVVPLRCERKEKKKKCLNEENGKTLDLETSHDAFFFFL